MKAQKIYSNKISPKLQMNNVLEIKPKGNKESACCSGPGKRHGLVAQRGEPDMGNGGADQATGNWNAREMKNTQLHSKGERTKSGRKTR